MTAVGNPETLLLQNGHVLGTGAVLLEIELGHFPNAIAESKKDLPLAFDQTPDFRGMFSHDVLPFPCATASALAFHDASAMAALYIRQNWYQYDAWRLKRCKRKPDN
jgi:hypothetical protein